MKPYFSIIIPTRNIGAYLREETFPSIDAQSFRDFEAFAITDVLPSDKNALEKKYTWLKIVSNSEKKRPGEKRDLVVTKSVGQVLAFIDDDVYPPKDWLKNAHKIFDASRSTVALGGPGLVPLHAHFWEKVFDSVLRSWIGSGAYTYRFVATSKRYVDDFPTMNLMMRKDVFIKINGFDNKHWPGEDSKLLNKLNHESKQKVLYHPDIWVYHHRRTSLMGHIKQHINYGDTRGTFAAQGDSNSISLMYVIPAFFLLYLISVIGMFFFIGFNAWTTWYSGGLIAYGALLIYMFFHSFWIYEDIFIAVFSSTVVPLTHISYGVFYMRGYLREKLGLTNS